MKLKVGLLTALLSSVVWFANAEAGVVTDGSRGVPRTVLIGPDFALDESHGSVNDDSGILYLSLESLSLSASETLTITAPDEVTAVVIGVNAGVVSLDGTVSLVNPPEQLVIAAPAGLLVGGNGDLVVADGVKLVLAAVDRLVFGDDILAVDSEGLPLPNGVPTAYVVPSDSGGFLRFSGTGLAFVGSDISLLGHRIFFEADSAIAVSEGGWLDIATEARDGTILENDFSGRPSSAGGSVTLDDASLNATDGDLSIYSDTIQLSNSSMGVSGVVPSGVFGLAGNVIGIDNSELTVVGGDEGTNLVISAPLLRIENGSKLQVDNNAEGGITIIGDTNLTVLDSQITSNTASPEGQAEVILRGRDVTLSGSLINANDPTENGGAVRVEALEATLRRGVVIETDGENTLSAGSIRIDTDDLVIDTGSEGDEVAFGTGTDNTNGGVIEFQFVEAGVVGQGDLNLTASGVTGEGEIRFVGSKIRFDESTTNITAFPEEVPANFSVVSDQIEGSDCSIAGERGPSLTFESEQALFERCTVSSGNLAGSAGNIVFVGPRLALSETRIESIGTLAAGSIVFEESESLTIEAGSFVESRGADGGGIHSLAGNVIGIVDSELTVEVGTGTAVSGDIELLADAILIDGGAITSSASAGTPSSLALGGDRLDVLNDTRLSTCSDNESGSGDVVLDFSHTIRFDADGDSPAAVVESCNEGTGTGGDVLIDTTTVVYYESPTFDTSSEGGRDGSVSTSGPNTVLIRREVFDGDDTCPQGGQRIVSGLDDGEPGGQQSNGLLEDDEIDDAIVACNDSGDDGADLLIESSPEPAGSNCIDGGVRVVAGPDDGDGEGAIANNGVLETSEIENTFFGCFGQGVPSTLVELAEEAPGDNCDNGGQRIDIGLDNGDGGGTANDDVLQLGEIDTTQFFCSEADDFDQLVILTELASGDDGCATGGTQIDTGLDDGDPSGNANDGELQLDEIDETVLVCNPPQSADESGCTQVDVPAPYANLILWFLALAVAVRRRTKPGLGTLD